MNDLYQLVLEEEVVEILEVGQQGLPGPPGEGMTPDIVAAIAGANAPSGENPFVTREELPEAPGDVGAEPANANIQGHIASTNNPHNTTAPQVGLGNVANKRQQTMHGFATLPAAPSFSSNTYTIPGSAPYLVYHDGVPTEISTDKSVTEAAPVVGTQYFIRMLADGSLTISTTPFDILSLASIPVDTAYYNGPGDWILADEMHAAGRNLIEHQNAHDSWGAQYVSGFSGLTVGTGAGGNSTNTFSLVGGVFRDEDRYHTLSNPQTQARIGYRDGTNGNRLKFDAAGAAYAKLNGAVPRYDNNGTLADLGVGKYGIAWLYATNRRATKVAVIVGQGEYSTIAAAQAAALPTLTGLNVAEWRLLYRVIIRNVGGALNWVQSDPLYNISTGPAINAGAAATIPAGNVSVTPYGTNITGNAQTSMENLEANKLAKEGDTINNYTEKVVQVGNFGASYSINLANGSEFHGTLDQNCAFTLPSAPATDRSASFLLVLTQGAGGNKSITAAGALGPDLTSALPSLNTTAGKVTELVVRYNRTKSAWVFYAGAKDA